MTRRKLDVAGMGLALVALTGAVAVAPTARGDARSEIAHAASASEAPVPQAPDSRPHFVTRGCGQNATVRAACHIAIRYLRALDGDRFPAACALLARDTLDNAGGMNGCITTLARARGARIRYAIHAVVETAL